MAIATDLGTFWGVLPDSLGLIALGVGLGSWLPSLSDGGQRWAQPSRQAALAPGAPRPVGRHSASFPSGHATYSMAFVLALILLN